MGILIGGFLTLAPSMGLFYAWGQWPTRSTEAKLTGWRLKMAKVAFTTVATQAALCWALWTPMSRYKPFLWTCLSIEPILLLVTVSCIIAWKGRARSRLVGRAFGDLLLLRTGLGRPLNQLSNASDFAVSENPGFSENGVL
jgi:hypothetical protein